MRNLITLEQGSSRRFLPLVPTAVAFVSRSLATVVAPAFLILVLGAAAGCDKASHENLDKWLETSKGPGKLEEALKDSDLDDGIRAHAARNLIRIGKQDVVFAFMDSASEATRTKVIAALTPQLWDKARIDGRMKVPSPVQTGAKDALFFLRKYSDETNRKQIDTYLLDWLTGGYYKGRAESGSVRGEQIVRAIGSGAASKMIAAINSIIAAPADAKGQSLAISDDLLLGVAVSGSRDAVAKLLEIALSEPLKKKHPKLLRRVMVALEKAYVDPEDFEAAEAAGLAGNIDALASLATDQNHKVEIQSIALNLVRASGMPVCLERLAAMIDYPHSSRRFRWIAAQRALDCGQIEGIISVAEAFPTTGSYSEVDIHDSLVSKIVDMKPKESVAQKARVLLKSDSWVARLIGIEVLGKLGLSSSAASDAEKLRALSGDRTPLRGWSGKNGGASKRSNSPSRSGKRSKSAKHGPRQQTLGSRAVEVAKRLQALAKRGEK